MGGLVAFEIARTDYLSRRSPLSRSCWETPGFPGLYRPVFEGQAALARTLTDDYIPIMCGRVIQSSGALRYAIVDDMNAHDSRLHNFSPYGMWRRAKNCWSSAAITRPGKYRWTHCAGA